MGCHVSRASPLSILKERGPAVNLMVRVGKLYSAVSGKGFAALASHIISEKTANGPELA